MKDGQKIDDMFRRMHILLNGHEALGERFLKVEINLKLLNNMPKIWELKTMTIVETNDLKKLKWDKHCKTWEN